MATISGRAARADVAVGQMNAPGFRPDRSVGAVPPADVVHPQSVPIDGSACAALTSAPPELATMGDEVAVSGQAQVAASGQFLMAANTVGVGSVSACR
jgi:hypothetical protein